MPSNLPFKQLAALK
ncbi:uncharacterized protein FFC1_06632 [Fusarium fujikuroi]|nr:uncharacterized protein FFC1_06632 [Fusarium fujikuroi]